jgi:O-antigen/teichoic acid export membrane protein
MVYSPFSQRFNHYVATDSDQNLKKLTFQLMNYTFPLCVLSVLILFLSSEKLILAWVGIEYASSISILQILITGTLFNFILLPASYYYTSTANYFFLKLNAFVLPIVFFISLFIFLPIIGVKGFAFSKVLALFTSSIISLYGLRHLIRIKDIIKEWYFTIFVNSFLIFFGLHYFFHFLFEKINKSKFDLIILSGVILVILFTVLFSTLLIKRSLRLSLIGYWKSYYFK